MNYKVIFLFLILSQNLKIDAQISDSMLTVVYDSIKNEGMDEFSESLVKSRAGIELLVASQNPSLNALTSNIVIGAVNFLADRSRDEIISLFMGRFGKFIDSTKVNNYSPLFPSTIGAIELIGENIYNYKSHIPTIKQAIYADIKLIPENLESVIPNIKGIKPIQRNMLEIALRYGKRLTNGTSIDEVVRGINLDLQELGVIDSDQKALTPTILLLYTFSSNTLPKIAHITSEFKQNINQNYPNNDLDYHSLLNEIGVFDPKDPSHLYQNTIRLLKLLPNQNDNYKEFLKYFEGTIKIIYNIRQNKFNLAIIEIVNLINEKTNKNISHQIKYLNFMASLAAANSSDQINAILKDTALPVSSYRLKRSGDTYVFINGYTGFKYSYDNASKSGEDNLNTFGLSAPIGISLSWWKNVGFFIPLVDLGQYLSYAGNTKVEDFPEVTLSNVFAPGGFVEWHIPNIFLTVSGGYTVGPWSRKEIATDQSNLYQGWQGNLKIDIPLYQLYNKENSK